MSHHHRPTTPLILAPVLALLLVACSGSGASTPPTGDGTAPPATPGGVPQESPGPSAPLGEIEHATGATDILLRYDEGGGFIMPAFTAAMTPHFTLYGDGTIVYRDPGLEGPPAQGSAFLMNPLLTAKLTEAHIQELLAFALGEGGLAAARPEYRNDMVADASTAMFTIHAGGIEKTVSVYALGMDGEGVPDLPARAAFGRLAERLLTLGNGGLLEVSDYQPAAYRVTLFESPGVVAPDLRAWPWDDIAVADFQPAGDPNGPPFPFTVMTSEQVAELGVTDFTGGFQNLVITGSDGVLYTMAVRPLLPGESR